MVSEEIYNKWYRELCDLEYGMHITSKHWIGRLIRGLAPVDDKAPWWERLQGEHLSNAINEGIRALEENKNMMDKVISMLKEMKVDFGIDGNEPIEG